MIKDRIAGEYGHLGALDRSVERIIASLTNWGVLAHTEQKQNYRILLHNFTSSENLQSWLLSCALQAHPSDTVPLTTWSIYQNSIHSESLSGLIV